MIESAEIKIADIKEGLMESRSYALVFIGPPTSGKSTFTNHVSETLHLPVIYGSRIIGPDLIPLDGLLVPDDIFSDSLEHLLFTEAPTGHIFDGIPRTRKQAEIISNWSKKTGFTLHVFDLEISEEEFIDRTLNREICPVCKESYHYKVKPTKHKNICDIDNSVLTRRTDDTREVALKRFKEFNKEKGEVLKPLEQNGFQIYRINSNGTIYDTSREIFNKLSPFSFDDPNLSRKYFEFKDLCESCGINYMLISGACGYIYRGRRPLKDLDILVPSLQDLKKLAELAGKNIEYIESSYAVSQYLNFSEGVEIVSDLSIKYPEGSQTKNIPFNFTNLDHASKIVRFFGENCKIMSPEWLIVFKLCLGRSGKDDFGHNKNDFADAYDVTVSQPVNYEIIRQIAGQIGAETKVEEGLEILKSSAN